jgi:hypothetical protein
LPANQRREDFCFTNRAFLLSADLMIPYGRYSIPSRETLSKWPYVSPDPSWSDVRNQAIGSITSNAWA